MANEIAFPTPLRQEEDELIRIRREHSGGRPQTHSDDPGADDRIGVALSGGGIRSATFALGLFQGMAKLGLLRRIDYLSTVSGGGYFGAFYGRLFTRAPVQSVAQVEQLLSLATEIPRAGKTAEPATSETTLSGPEVIDWLRENGRYLAPRGAGDYLMALTVLLRNWFAVQTVTSLAALTVMLMFTVPLAFVEDAAWAQDRFAQFGAIIGGPHSPVWTSPVLIVPVLLFAGVLFPLNWAYWIASLPVDREREVRNFSLSNPLAGPVAIVLMALLLQLVRNSELQLLLAITSTIAAIGLFAVLLWCVARARVRKLGTSIDRKHAVTQRLSNWMKWVLQWTLIIAAIGLVDTAGRTLYALVIYGHAELTHALGALAGVVGLAVARGQTLIGALSKKDGGTRLPMDVVASVAGILLTLVVLVLINFGAHAIVWRMDAPPTVPGYFEDYLKHLVCQNPQVDCALRLGYRLPARIATDFYAGAIPALATLVLAFVVSFLLGLQWTFCNQSTLQPLYSARLTRAYLGASNPRRLASADARVTDPIPGDDIADSEYWSRASGPWNKGGPLHLVNVTINETTLGRSQIQQQDRHGVGMARGPCALSVGVRHHRMDQSRIWPPAGQGYQVFHDSFEAPESMPLSQWIGISGAAFSTGMGFNTRIGLSLLVGLLNVRLGYWWDSHIGARPRRFPVQHFLMIYEWLARFPGTARRFWYLSDGGHFENTAAYELIRRRLPLIIVSDGSADANYQFDDVANLVRKARIDFGAEIEFLGADDIRQTPALIRDGHCYFGSLDELRGKAEVQSWPEIGGSSIQRLPCAAIARVRYRDEPQRSSWLLLLKPTVHAGDPTDLVNYGLINPSFPNQTTVDQFFDEAQWESYRKLGELIATRVLSHDDAPQAAAQIDDPLACLRGFPAAGTD